MFNIKGKCIICGKECETSRHDPLRTFCSKKCAYTYSQKDHKFNLF